MGLHLALLRRGQEGLCVEGMQENTVNVGIKYISTLTVIGGNNVLIDWC